MAILKNGIYGGVSGKLGNTVTYHLNKQTVVRIIGKSNDPATEKQLVRRKELSVVTAFLKVVNSFINVGFKAAAEEAGMYPQNKAVSYNKVNALSGVYPEIFVNYEKVLLSMGELPLLEAPAVTLVADGLKFSWEPQLWMGWPRCNDQVMLMAYMPDATSDGCAFYVLSGARRIAGGDFLRIPAELTGNYMEVYIAVVSDDRSGVSNSQYLGSVGA